MIQTLVATLMWALVASLLIFRRKRTDRSHLRRPHHRHRDDAERR